MEYIEKVIEYSRPDSFRFYAFGDVHAGVLQCAEKNAKRKIADIRQEKNSYIIGMGDYSECITPSDPRWNPSLIAPWVKRDNVAESQRRFVVSLFQPVKNRIIALLTGNHEEAIHRYLNDDIAGNIVDDLGVPYGGYQCFIDLVFRRKHTSESHRYRIHAWHGAGSAQTEGARLMRLKRLVKEFEADIYLMGHLHAITHDITDRITVRAGRLKQIPQIATITGSFLKTYMQAVPPGYGERAGYKPSHLGCPCIIINPDKDSVIYQS